GDRVLLNILDTAGRLFQFNTFDLERDQHVFAGLGVDGLEERSFRHFDRKRFHTVAVHNGREHLIAADGARLAGPIRGSGFGLQFKSLHRTLLSCPVRGLNSLLRLVDFYSLLNTDTTPKELAKLLTGSIYASTPVPEKSVLIETL